MSDKFNPSHVFENFSYRNKIEREIYPHEIYMAFTDDEGAYAFQEWMDEEGLARFNQFCQEYYPDQASYYDE